MPLTNYLIQGKFVCSKSNSKRLGKYIREAIYSYCALKKLSNNLFILFSTPFLLAIFP